jgi:hypothetical protein
MRCRDSPYPVVVVSRRRATDSALGWRKALLVVEAGLASQMGGLGIAADAGARTHRKKHRHAHHDIGVLDPCQC